jgi:GNAT superfamily N-acetyltransferase
VALAREEAASGSAARPGPGAAERLRALTQRQLLDPDAVMFLALAGSREVGILRCADGGRLRPARRHALVTTAYVTRSHRRRGVLRALLACAEAWCRARGAQGMRLRVGSGNSAGHAAWLSLGFAPQAVLMRRPLAD